MQEESLLYITNDSMDGFSLNFLGRILKFFENGQFYCVILLSPPVFLLFCLLNPLNIQKAVIRFAAKPHKHSFINNAVRKYTDTCVRIRLKLFLKKVVFPLKKRQH